MIVVRTGWFHFRRDFSMYERLFGRAVVGQAELTMYSST